MSKVERLARMRVYSRRHGEGPPEVDTKENARVGANRGGVRRETLAEKKKKVMGMSGLSREELMEMKKQAVVREREKRRKMRLQQQSDEKEALVQAKEEAVRRERRRSSVSSIGSSASVRSLLSHVSARTKASISKDEILQYKEEAKRREMQKERLRRKRLALQGVPPPTAADEVKFRKDSARSTFEELQEYKAKAVERERTKIRKDSKVLRSQLIENIGQLEKEFYALAEGEARLVPVSRVLKLMQRCPGYAIIEGNISNAKFISWATLCVSLREKKPKEKPKKTKRDLERELKSVLCLCETSFNQLERFSDSPGKVRPSDLNALHGAATGNDFRILCGGLELPNLVTRDDEPVSWIQYRDWLLKAVLEDSPENSKIFASHWKSWLERNPAPTSKQHDSPVAKRPNNSDKVAQHTDNFVTKLEKKKEISQEKENIGKESQTKSRQRRWDKPQASEAFFHADLKTVDRKIKSLEERLTKQEEVEEESDVLSVSSASSAQQDEDTVQDEDEDEEEEEEEEDTEDKVLYSGRCWMLCERKNEMWFDPEYDDESSSEWVRSLEICAEVEVTQVKSPFRMYIGVHLLRSGLRCMRRIGVEELTALTAYCAQQSEKNDLSLSKSGHHVIMPATKHKCKSLGPEEWTSKELKAAIKAEEDMRKWIQEGRIPKQNDLVQWLLLRATIRISGDELDPDESHVHILLPGDIDESESKPATVLDDHINYVEKKTKTKAEKVVEHEHDFTRLLNRQDPGIEDVQTWFSSRKSKFGKLLRHLCSPEIDERSVHELLERHKSVKSTLYSLVDEESLVKEWKQHTRGLRVADIFDVFRSHEGEDAGTVNLKTFVAILQDTLLLKIPEWQLVVWHHRFPMYRDFVRFIFKKITA
mmetsp:Transcript_4860/g.8787  ORF Transcript_4860/g.8787 Transcript_4860/m.8787 type:complete len:879 (+) Transcript_4860:215-2851(+)